MNRVVRIGKKTIERDTRIVLPAGEEVVIQFRNYDGTAEAGFTLDILLPTPMPVNNFLGVEMKPAPAMGRGHVREADQLTLIF